MNKTGSSVLIFFFTNRVCLLSTDTADLHTLHTRARHDDFLRWTYAKPKPDA